MNTVNTTTTVVSIIHRLGDGGAPCLLFGGWAEEALGLREPHPHSDLDLLLPAPSFENLDGLLAVSCDLQEVPLKRFAHKRAFLVGNVLIEVILVQQENGTPLTWFWGDRRFEWLNPLTESCSLGGHQLAAVSRENLQWYRDNHRSMEPWRWKDAAAIPG